MGEWLPIETAPKSPTEYVDLWTSLDERITDAWWNPKRERWEHWGIDDFDNMAWVKVDERPTHWMPPPKPPAA